MRIADVPSINDVKEILKKFPAFVIAPLSQKAIDSGTISYKKDVFGNEHGMFCILAPNLWGEGLRTASAAGDTFYPVYVNDTGIRPSIQVIYNAESEIVKSCRIVEKTTKTENDEVTSKAPVVTFAKKDYIWLNKKECENKSEKTMRLISTEVQAKANVEFETKTFAERCEEEVLEFATEEEKSMLVKYGYLSNNDASKVAVMNELGEIHKSFDEGRGGM